MISFILLAPLGLTILTQSKAYIEAGGPPHGKQMASEVNTVVFWFFVIHFVGRVFLLIASVKYLQIVKCFLYYEFIAVILTQMLVVERSL